MQAAVGEWYRQPVAPAHACLWLQGTASSTFSVLLRKVVRRASLSDRTNLYRKEYEGEAILWQQRSAAEDQRTSTYNGDIRETRTDQENKDPVRDLLPSLSVGHCLGKRTESRLVLLPPLGSTRKKIAGQCP